ncbi:MAG TPA: diacylglycerol kinase family protein [Gemmatimonadales bacterium]|nr:diacylglycerol kinase family protein [Gemmatimonadales bacterium]
MGWIAVVLNDSSGSGEGAAAARRLEEIFRAAGREARITVARSGGELRAAAERFVADGCGVLVAGGGDGTVNTGAAAVLRRSIPLGVLPLGTLNHFAKDMGIPLDLEGAAQVILGGVVCKVDVGEVNGRLFLNNSSLGVYPAIVRLRERYQATGWGKWVAALWASLTVLRRNPFMGVRITVEGQALLRRTPFVFVGNNEYRMVGLQAGARDSLARGRLAVYVLNAERRRGLLLLAWQVVLKGVDHVKELDLLTVEEATIETRRQRLQVALDGEVVPLGSPLECRIRPGALRVLVPPAASACYPHGVG